MARFKCPKCGHAGTFQVWADAQFDMDESGELEMAWTPSWTSKNQCECPACSFAGTIGDFEDNGGAE